MTYHMKDRFGQYCFDGEKAILFVHEEIIPHIYTDEKFVFDFDSVRNMNSSFANALFENLLSKFGKPLLTRIKFMNCRENIKVMISSAIEMGITDFINKEEKFGHLETA